MLSYRIAWYISDCNRDAGILGSLHIYCIRNSGTMYICDVNSDIKYEIVKVLDILGSLACNLKLLYKITNAEIFQGLQVSQVHASDPQYF